MKKILLLIFIMCNVCFAYAKDVIVLKTSETIEAKIMEISPDEIKYKRINNLKGPTFSIKISDVSTVVYENGDVESFAKKEQEKSKSAEENTASNVAISNSNSNLNSNSELDKNLYPVISNESSDYEMNGKVLSKKELEVYFKNNCPIAYNKWTEGKTKRTVGTTLLVIGTTCCVISTVANISHMNSDFSNTTANAVGTATLIVGILSDVASIPFIVSGCKARRNSIELYNENCASKNSSFNLKMNIKGNGFGLAMTF